eukprot:953351-Pelagomonas_calceolata.AAC.1
MQSLSVEGRCYYIGQVLWLCGMLCRGHHNDEGSSSQHICRSYCRYRHVGYHAKPTSSLDHHSKLRETTSPTECKPATSALED